MNSNMAIARLWAFITLTLHGVSAEGQFVVLNTPPSITFEGSDTLGETFLKEVYFAALCISTGQKPFWSAMKITNPFEMPEAVVEVYVNGINSIGSFGDDAKVYPITKESLHILETTDGIINRLLRRNESRSILVSAELLTESKEKLYSHIFGQYSNLEASNVTFSHLNYTNTPDPDNDFIRELQTLKSITNAVKAGALKPDGIRDFYAFKFTSLKPLLNLRRRKFLKFIEAKKLLNQQIRELCKSFVAAYSGRVLFTVVLSDSYNRVRRYAQQDNEATTNSFYDQNLFDILNRYEPLDIYDEASRSDKYNDDQATVHIIFWVCLTLFYSMLAIVYVIVTLDPGRDSIVYRMTSAIDRVKME